MNSKQGRFLIKETSDSDRRDADLIARICNADEQAFELLYHSYYRRLFRFIARITRQPEVIEEVINDVMYVVWGKAASYDQRCRPSTWIFGIAYNKARQTFRNFDSGDENSLEDLGADSDVFGRLDVGLTQMELDNWLDAAFDQLSPEQRAVIELTYYHGMHYNEIAVLMSCPENTVKTRMHHARKKLAIILKTMDPDSKTTS